MYDFLTSVNCTRIADKTPDIINGPDNWTIQQSTRRVVSGRKMLYISQDARNLIAALLWSWSIRRTFAWQNRAYSHHFYFSMGTPPTWIQVAVDEGGLPSLRKGVKKISPCELFIVFPSANDIRKTMQLLRQAFKITRVVCRSQGHFVDALWLPSKLFIRLSLS